MTPIPVSLTHAQSYQRELLAPALRTLLHPLGGLAAFIHPGDRVLLKPNMLTGKHPGKECITNPQLVRCVAELVQACGAHPFIGDSPTFYSAHGVARAAGYLPWLQELNVPVVELHGQPYPTGNPEFSHLRLSKEAMAADVVINLPKVKSHSQLTLTLGVKNLFGCVPGKTKTWWHMEAGADHRRFSAMLVETANTIGPDLTIIDGIIGHEGDGPSNGEPRPLGLVGASTNVFALDYVISKILQINPSLVPTIAASIAMGLCPPEDAIYYPLLTPDTLIVEDWQLAPKPIPIDFGLPRVLRSTLKTVFTRLIKEPISHYYDRSPS